MTHRWLLPVFFTIIIFIVLPVNAHVPVSTDDNNRLTSAFSAHAGRPSDGSVTKLSKTPVRPVLERL